MAETKLYSEKDISLILKKALELQHRQKAPSPSGQGISLEELTSAGKEAGIDPAFIRQAALTLGNEPSKLSGWAGGPLDLRLEAVVEGVRDEDSLKELQMQMGALAQGPGNGLVHKGRLAWDAQPSSYTTQYLPWRLQVGPDEGKTRVSLEVDLKVWAWSLHGALIGGLGVGLGLVSGVALGLEQRNVVGAAVSVPLCLLGSYLLAWALYRWTVRWAEKKGRKILGLVAARLEQ